MTGPEPKAADRAVLRFDAIVVGSGITGGWAAKELTERGLKVLLLERGADLEHGAGYVTEHSLPWDLKFRGLGNQRDYAKRFPVHRNLYAFSEYTEHLFASDRQAPYSTDPGRPYHWFRSHMLGGRSVTWGRQVYRWSDLDFEANRRDGHGVDWPIRYADIAPWYDRVEAFIGVSGQAEGLDQLPDGQFLPPMAMNCPEKAFKAAVEAQYPDRRVTIGRCAILTVPHNGRAACHYCGPCTRGCSTGSYFSSLSSTLPAARATGRLTIRTDALVERLIVDETGNRIRGVRFVDTGLGQRQDVEAPIVFLCASAIASAQILLNSADKRHPAGAANSSGCVGRYLMDHVNGFGAKGLMPGFDDRQTTGERPNDIYIPRFRNVAAADQPFVRGYGYQAQAARGDWRRGIESSVVGEALMADLRRPGPWQISLSGFGECLPRAENRVTLDRSRTDRWGIPVPHIRFAFGENERAIAEDAARQAGEMLRAAGATNVSVRQGPGEPGLAIHEMGTVRMGRDPTTSALNGFNQSHDHPNLFVTDGAAMASSACQNPSLTYMALTARAAHHAADLLAGGRFA